MRVIVFFDLPMTSSKNIRDYTKFRKHLLSDGFLMMQESVYVKLALNKTVSSGIVQRIKMNAPKEGVIQLLEITEKQYNRMDYIIGRKESTVIDTEERLIIL